MASLGSLSNSLISKQVYMMSILHIYPDNCFFFFLAFVSLLAIRKKLSLRSYFDVPQYNCALNNMDVSNDE